eukprot:760754-Alexandrium_andersonii.AAC.1
MNATRSNTDWQQRLGTSAFSKHHQRLAPRNSTPLFVAAAAREPPPGRRRWLPGRPARGRNKGAQCTVMQPPR